jgi:hypothetical protein
VCENDARRAKNIAMTGEKERGVWQGKSEFQAVFMVHTEIPHKRLMDFRAVDVAIRTELSRI